ncbi:MAG: DNA-binding response regulator [Hapalosiphonaceae cyanobacterium JJU2]|nr:MAG: DNA-binding response regulator [Hapalosiphonaceae cyanobacterium JJU2]
MKQIKVAIIENEDVSRIGAATILSEIDKIQVCGVAKYGKEGLEIINKQQPDVVIVNIDLPDISGTEIISILKYKHEAVKIVVMTANSNREVISATLSNGADCYYSKSCAREEKGERLIEAVLAAYNGESWIDPTINRILIDSLRSKDFLETNQHELLREFSVKEITILKLVAQGMKNDQIANKIYLSEGTVRSYMHTTFTKLGVKDKLNAVREGIRVGILDFADMKIGQENTEEPYREVNKTKQKSQKTSSRHKNWAA